MNSSQPEVNAADSVSDPNPDNGDDDSSGNWWTRRCGGREVMTLALPLVLSTVSWTLMNFVDRTFLLWHDTDSMAAAMPAGAVSFTAICLPMGIAAYASTFVAQYNGAGQLGRIGQVVWQGVWLGIACIPVFLLLRGLAPVLFANVGHAPHIATMEAQYFQTLMFGAAAVVISTALSGFFSGREETVVIMKVDASTALLNIALDYIWIFGKFGFPEGGIVGAALATAVSSWVRAAIYLVLVLRRDRQNTFGFRGGASINVATLRRLIWFGGPSGLQTFVEMAAFSSYVLLVGQLGEIELAATTLAFNINEIAFVPLLGLGFAVSILVGNQIGRKRVDLAERATWTTLSIAVGYATFMALLYWLVPGAFLVVHEMGADAEEFGVVRDTTIVLLRFVAAYCILDAVLIVFAGAIKGAGDTQFVLFAAILMSPWTVVLGWVGIHYLDWGLTQFWFLVTFWIMAQAVVYASRFLHGKWRSMQVIEPT